MTAAGGSRRVGRCDACPGRPLLATLDEAEHDSRRCVRCQGKNRVLPIPHPEDHLCGPCRRECPECGDPTPAGGRCRACQGVCRDCGGPLPARELPPPVRIPAGERKDGGRWDRMRFTRAWLHQRCDACRTATGSPTDPVRTVLAALPDPVVRGCGGAVPQTVVETVRVELRERTALQLAARIERRWWATWSHRHLARSPGTQSGAVRADDVAVQLVAPTGCPGRCEDGWQLAPTDRPELDDTPCEHCHGGQRLRPPTLERLGDQERGDRFEERAPTGADRSVVDALTYRPPVRECPGEDGACGRPVAAPYVFCPNCSNWPWCGGCERRRYDPVRAERCRICSAVRPGG